MHQNAHNFCVHAVAQPSPEAGGRDCTSRRRGARDAAAFLQSLATYMHVHLHARVRGRLHVQPPKEQFSNDSLKPAAFSVAPFEVVPLPHCRGLLTTIHVWNRQRHRLTVWIRGTVQEHCPPLDCAVLWR